MTPEEKMLERFTREKQTRHTKNSMFDLEDDDEEGQLTHFGKSLSFNQKEEVDDFQEDDEGLSDEDDHGSDTSSLKRRLRRIEDGEEELSDISGEEDEPKRKKTKAEVMKEVIAKSKLHRYERQQAKEEDEDLREELDKELPDLFALMNGMARPRPPPLQKAAQLDDQSMNPERLAFINKKDRKETDKEYDERVREMVYDKKSAPTERTKTEEEKVKDDKERLEKLEKKRQRRMRGEADSSDDEDHSDEGQGGDQDLDVEDEDEEDFGLGSGIKGPVEEDLGVEGEDEFLLDDIIASGSDVDVDDSDSNGSDSGMDDEDSGEDDEDRDFLRDVMPGDVEITRHMGSSAPVEPIVVANGINGDLPYTFPCPTTHEAFLDVVRTINVADHPIVVQRIRALYHPKLAAENKQKLGLFSTTLIDHIRYLTSLEQPPFAVIETITRHIHSLAKTYPETISKHFRSHISSIQSSGVIAVSDLVVFTAICSIFPTSDHFHQVVTPAILCMTRYLEQSIPKTLPDMMLGAFVVTICLQVCLAIKFV
jgi:nucleolar protein 14